MHTIVYLLIIIVLIVILISLINVIEYFGDELDIRKDNIDRYYDTALELRNHF